MHSVLCRQTRHPAHAVRPHEHARHLPESPADRLLHVRHTMARAERLDLRLHTPIREHGHVGEEMMLDLVVEEEMGVVDPIAARRRIADAVIAAGKHPF